jgi:hypothetical protein
MFSVPANGVAQIHRITRLGIATRQDGNRRTGVIIINITNGCATMARIQNYPK